jgi:aspartate racemase
MDPIEIRMPTPNPRHIGIVGCSAEGAALCYRTICLEGTRALGPHQHPQVSLHTHALGEYLPWIESGAWESVAKLMLSSATKLAAAGAEFLICPDNTIHQALPLVEPRSPLPWLHIARVVAAEASRRGFRRLGLTGTRFLLESSIYPDALSARGLGWVVPDTPERVEINRIIFDQLVNAIFTDGAVAYFQSVIERMRQQGADAVILGCTEIPLLMNDSNSPLATLDSTRLLARAALRHSLESGDARYES